MLRMLSEIPDQAPAVRLAEAGGDTSVLRQAADLPAEAWEAFDAEIAAALRQALVVGAFFTPLGIANALGRETYGLRGWSAMEFGGLTMGGQSRTRDQALDVHTTTVPLPIAHADYNLDARSVAAAGNIQAALEEASGDAAGFVVADIIETLAVNGNGPGGAPAQFNGVRIYGLQSARDDAGFPKLVDTNGTFDTGENIVKSVMLGIDKLDEAGFPGPFNVVLAGNLKSKLGEDYRGAGDSRTLEERIRQITGISGVVSSRKVSNDRLYVMQSGPFGPRMIDGIAPQAINWTVQPRQTAYQAFAIQVPGFRQFTGAGGDRVVGVCEVT